MLAILNVMPLSAVGLQLGFFLNFNLSEVPAGDYKKGSTSLFFANLSFKWQVKRLKHNTIDDDVTISNTHIANRRSYFAFRPALYARCGQYASLHTLIISAQMAQKPCSIKQAMERKYLPALLYIDPLRWLLPLHWSRGVGLYMVNNIDCFVFLRSWTILIYLGLG